MTSLLRRLKPLDRLLLLGVFPIWLVFFGLHVIRWSTVGIAVPGVYVTEATGCPGYPVVRTLHTSRDAQALELRPGDELLQVGVRDLACAGPLRFFADALGAMDREQRAPIVFRRDGETRKTSLSFTPMPLPIRYVAVSGALAGTGLLLLLRAPRSRAATAVFAGFLLFSFGYLRAWGGPIELTYVLVGVSFILGALAVPAAVRGVIAFPDDSIRHGRWASWVPWLFLPVGPLFLNSIVGVPLFWGDAHLSKPLSELLLAVLGVVMVSVITSNYLRCDPLGRRKIRWVVTGFYLGLVPVAIATLISVARPDYWWLSDVSEIVIVLVPLSMLIAVFRYNLFDIDRLISAAASYSLLSSGVVLIGMLLLPKLSPLFVSALGIEPKVQPYLVAASLAAAVIGGNRALQPALERRLFPYYQTLTERIHALLDELSELKTPVELAVRAAERIDELLKPESCVIYVREGDGYRAVFARGPAVAQVLASTHPIVAALYSRTEPLAAETWSRRSGHVLGPFDSAVLESLDAALLFPVQLQRQLLAFVSLGPKRSGDIYTKAEVDLVDSVVSNVALQLERFELKDMREAFRRYVPGAVADALAARKGLEASVREVSVMFVDIRGYTGYSERRQASDIFSTVNRYTELVSGTVRRHGGSVVEFNGDGMMSVFGAPQELESKETSAVRAGLDLLQSLDAMPLVGTGSTQRISVGVGIATGDAYVGSIQAVDRLIWSAIGNTTNLASRLQSLTRTLNASMAIDGTTADRIGSLAKLFERQSDVRVRGRAETLDVCVLPLREEPV